MPTAAYRLTHKSFVLQKGHVSEEPGETSGTPNRLTPQLQMKPMSNRERLGGKAVAPSLPSRLGLRVSSGRPYSLKGNSLSCAFLTIARLVPPIFPSVQGGVLLLQGWGRWDGILLMQTADYLCPFLYGKKPF